MQTYHKALKVIKASLPTYLNPHDNRFAELESAEECVLPDFGVSRNFASSRRMANSGDEVL